LAHVYFLGHGDVNIDLTGAALISTILPQLKVLEIAFVVEWGAGAYRSVVNSLAFHQSSLPCFEFCIIPHLISTELLDEVLKNNKDLQVLKLIVDLDGGFNDAYFASCISGIQNSPKLEEARICNGFLSNGSVLEQFLPQTTLKRLTLTGLKVEGSSVSSGWNLNECQIEELHLSCGAISTAGWCYSLLSKLGSMPMLKSLSLSLRAKTSSRLDIGEKIGDIISEQTSLNKLHLRGAVDMTPIAQALRANTSVEELKLRAWVGFRTRTAQQNNALLDTLKHYNTSLTTVILRGFDPEAMSKICHYALVNKHGRAKARCPETSLAEFLELLLCSAVGKPGKLAKYLGVTFDLLRACPSLWSGVSVGSRKRKLRND
jgi:hypothetical protein